MYKKGIFVSATQRQQILMTEMNKEKTLVEM